ncbi:MAG: ABC transporter ATP-binding protein [Phycisphaeraceae bacterium]|nr:ABC transporter ATP-binding protein [Phycisphaeraceae bacterium]
MSVPISSDPILRVRDLAVSFPARAPGEEKFHAADGVSFTIHPKQTLAIVGESGSGKSVTAMSLLKLIPASRVERGRADFVSRKGIVDLLALDAPSMRRIRGAEIAMIFQEPMSSLNPVFTVGEQIVEAVRIHQGAGSKQAKQIALDAMRSVGIREPETRFSQYPHQFSGGMRQRVMIAMALSCQPSLLIADEPTTALDVTIQAQILELLRSLKDSRSMSVLLITHDMGVVAENADVVCVMYGGRVVEYASVETIFAHPLHPYTRGLLASVPRLGRPRERLITVREVLDNPSEFAPVPCLASGEESVVPWFPGVHAAQGGTRTSAPRLVEVRSGHWIAAWQSARAAEPPREPDNAFRREAGAAESASSI